MIILHVKQCRNLIVAIGVDPSHKSPRNIVIGKRAGSLAHSHKCPVYTPWNIDIDHKRNKLRDADTVGSSKDRIIETIGARQEDGKRLSPAALTMDIMKNVQERGVERIWLVAAPHLLECHKKDLKAAALKSGLEIEIELCVIRTQPLEFWTAPVPDQGYEHLKKSLNLRSLLLKIVPFRLFRLFA